MAVQCCPAAALTRPSMLQDWASMLPKGRELEAMEVRGGWGPGRHTAHGAPQLRPDASARGALTCGCPAIARPPAPPASCQVAFDYGYASASAFADEQGY